MILIQQKTFNKNIDDSHWLKKKGNWSLATKEKKINQIQDQLATKENEIKIGINISMASQQSLHQ